MKGIGVAGGGGQPRPPQPPSRPRRRHILWGPRAAQTPTPPSPGTTRASAVRPGAARSPRPGAAGLAPGAAVQTLAPGWGGQRVPRGGPELPTGERRMRPLFCEVGRAAGMRASRLGAGGLLRCGASASWAAPEKLRTPQRVCPLLPVCLPLQILRAGIGPSGGIVKYSRLPESNKQGETLLCCRCCSLLWWVSASRDAVPVNTL